MNDETTPLTYPDYETILLLGMLDLDEETMDSWVFTLEEILDLPQVPR